MTISMRTKYRGPTDRSGSKIVVSLSHRATSYSFDYQPALNNEENHREAAIKAVRKYSASQGYLDDGRWDVIGVAFKGDWYWQEIRLPKGT